MQRSSLLFLLYNLPFSSFNKIIVHRMSRVRRLELYWYFTISLARMLLNVSFHLFAHMYAKGLDWVIYKDAFPLLHVSDSVQSKVIVLNVTAIIGK